MKKEVLKALKSHEDRENALILKKFFKTGVGEYGEGDEFLGINVPTQRIIAKKYSEGISLEEIKELLMNKYHEARMTALLMLERKYDKGNNKERKRIKEFYIKNTQGINNWDLVDLSAPKILGRWIQKVPEDKKIIYRLVKSKNLWKKRIGMISTYELIRNNDYHDALKTAELLLDDKHDLIHKAVGWMLREIGNRDRGVLEEFLRRLHGKMPRTTLRYAIERLPEKARKEWLKK